MPDEILNRFKDELNQKGYLIFISEMGYFDPLSMSIIKSTDQFDFIRLQKTDGRNYDVMNEDVINKLREWDSKYGI
jgi:hypothetical protein